MYLFRGLTVFSISILLGTVLGSTKDFSKQKLQKTTPKPEIDKPYCPGTGWTSLPGIDDKCYHLIAKNLERKNAVSACEDRKGKSENYTPILASIKSAVEQEAIVNFLYKEKNLSVNFWTGGMRSSKNASQFVWADGTPVNYTNWAVGAPTQNPIRDCIQLQSSLGSSPEINSGLLASPRITNNITGKWGDVTCHLANHVLCEKPQVWSMEKMQNELKKIKQTMLTDLEKVKQTMLAELQKVKQSQGQILNQALPVGFIYVQLPSQSMPQLLWPQFTWVDVSELYKSAFFRVTGSKSGEFGSVQPESVPFINGVQYDNCRGDDEPSAFDKDKCSSKPDFNYAFNASFSLSDDGWSPYIVTSNMYNSVYNHLPMWIGGVKINRKYDEVRPENMAVKVWKRTK